MQILLDKQGMSITELRGHIQVHDRTGTYSSCQLPVACIVVTCRIATGWECSCCKSVNAMWWNYSLIKYSRLIFQHVISSHKWCYKYSNDPWMEKSFPSADLDHLVWSFSLHGITCLPWSANKTFFLNQVYVVWMYEPCALSLHFLLFRLLDLCTYTCWWHSRWEEHLFCLLLNEFSRLLCDH